MYICQRYRDRLRRFVKNDSWFTRDSDTSMAVFAILLLVIINNEDATNQDPWAVSRASRSERFGIVFFFKYSFFYIATSVCNSWNVRKRSWNVDVGGRVECRKGKTNRWRSWAKGWVIGMPGEWQLKHFFNRNKTNDFEPNTNQFNP